MRTKCIDLLSTLSARQTPFGSLPRIPWRRKQRRRRETRCIGTSAAREFGWEGCVQHPLGSADGDQLPGSSPNSSRAASWSGTPECSTILPFFTRTISMTSIDKRRPEGGWPMNGPRWVPVARNRAQILSPATSIASVERCKSGKAVRRLRIISRNAIEVGGTPGGSLCRSTKPGSNTSSSTLRSPWLNPRSMSLRRGFSLSAVIS